jgi:hypothetical protein
VLHKGRHSTLPHMMEDGVDPKVTIQNRSQSLSNAKDTAHREMAGLSPFRSVPIIVAVESEDKGAHGHRNPPNPCKQIPALPSRSPTQTFDAKYGSGATASSRMPRLPSQQSHIGGRASSGAVQ